MSKDKEMKTVFRIQIFASGAQLSKYKRKIKDRKTKEMVLAPEEPTIIFIATKITPYTIGDVLIPGAIKAKGKFKRRKNSEWLVINAPFIIQEVLIDPNAPKREFAPRKGGKSAADDEAPKGKMSFKDRMKLKKKNKKHHRD